MKSLIILIIISFYNLNSFAVEPLLIKGGNDSKILINIKKVTSNDLSSFSTSYKIKRRIKKQLEDTNLFEIKNLSPRESNKKQILLKKLSYAFFNNSPVYSELTVSLDSMPGNMISANVTLYDLFSTKNIIETNITFSKELWHQGAAQISDLIYKYYTGLEGYINTRIAFISERGSLFSRNKKVAVMDLYGDNVKYITYGDDLVLTPRLSPDAKNIIYISYKSGLPAIYKLNLASNLTEKLFNIDRMVYAPRFSHDSKKIVLVVSYEGNSEIAIYDLEQKHLRRLTNNYAIDTSPSFSPGGNKIIFSSDRSGAQNLYLMNIDGSNLQQINLGNGNFATPNWSPDGKYIAFTKIYQGNFYIGILNMNNFAVKILTKSYKDESPSWAPNSKFIIFNRKKASNKNIEKGTSKLYMINLNGEIIKAIDTPYDASEADWVKIPTGL
ncbi:MAG: Tol-Pal system protein TolB [Alphaproteobacteria bacterium]|jgi:TolB protein|nr:Tol-Pal system protein TolB [Alphaproteobacteria bacterium]MBT5828497.1 Tol-Pal system protein TolB [Alphaproteobacteria bacterium]